MPNDKKWYLMYSIMMDPSQGESVRDKEVPLDATTEVAATAEARAKWEDILGEFEKKGLEFCYQGASVFYRYQL